LFRLRPGYSVERTALRLAIPRLDNPQAYFYYPAPLFPGYWCCDRFGDLVFFNEPVYNLDDNRVYDNLFFPIERSETEDLLARNAYNRNEYLKEEERREIYKFLMKHSNK